MSELNDELVSKHRTTLLVEFSNVLRGHHPKTPELQEAAVQACCALAGTMFAAQQGINIDRREMTSTLMSAAYDGLHDWLDNDNRRN